MKDAGQSPCKVKTNFHKCCSPSPWLRVRSFPLAKMYTWKAVRDRKFWASHCLGMLQVLKRKRGSEPNTGPGYALSVCYSFYDQNPGCPWPTSWPLLHLASWWEPPLPLSLPFWGPSACALLLDQHPISLLDFLFIVIIALLFSCKSHNHICMWGAR